MTNFQISVLDPKSNFNIYRRDRISRWPAGGVAIFIHKSLHSCLNASIDNGSYPDTEMIAANVYLASAVKLCILCAYLPPNLPIDIFHRNMDYLDNICAKEDVIIAVGDFNLPSIDWHRNIPGNDAKSVEFFDIISTHGLKQYIIEPTRLNNILDLVLCNDHTIISEVELDVPFGMSDHNSIIFTIIVAVGDMDSTIDPAPEPVRIWKNTDWQNLSIYCQGIDWYNLISEKQGADELWEVFCATVMEGVERYVPKVSCSKANNSLGNTKRKNKTIAKLSAKKKKLWLKKKRKCSKRNKEKYKKAAKDYKLAAASAQELTELKLIESNDLGQFYKRVNCASVHKTGIGPLKTLTGELVLDDQKKAELLNDYFVSVCTKDNGLLPPLPPIVAEDEPKLESITFNVHKIKLTLKKLKNKFSSGPDGLPPILFKNLANQLAYPLAKIFNRLILVGEVPNIWKKANVVPIFKKGSSASPKNYRPISLTCVGSKVFETIIKSILVPFFEGKKLISEHQHGFRAGHSTCLNLLEALNDWTENLDLKADTLVAHVDFARAFDSVSLPKLMHKLKWAGIEGQLYACLKSLLFNRSQRVKIGNLFSNYQTVCSGVPQGSVLGPILFIFYINDISGDIFPQSTPKLYADDLKAYSSSAGDMECKAFKETLSKIAKWAETWQLPINCEKSKWLLISNKKRPEVDDPKNRPFELAGIELPVTNEVLDLGVNFNSKLNFSDHISTIIAKAKQRLFLLKKIFISRNPRILILAYKTYVIPLLEYCSQVWNPQNQNDIRRLESVQRLFTKRLPGYQGLNYAARLDKAGLSTLELRRLRADLYFCYKILHGLIDTPINNFFTLDRPGDRPTRGHSWKIKPITPRLDTRLHFFSFRIVNAWNSLSPSTVEANSFIAFRALLRSECLDSFLFITS